MPCSQVSRRRFRDLSSAWRQLIELIQRINFGRVENLIVRGGEPIFDPPPRVVREVRFPGDNTPRAEMGLSDFVLKQQHLEFIELLADLRDGVITVLTVKNGLPFHAALLD